MTIDPLTDKMLKEFKERLANLQHIHNMLNTFFIAPKQPSGAKMTKLFSQDDCAPDSLGVFVKRIKEQTGYTIRNFVEDGVFARFDEGRGLRWELGEYALEWHCENPYNVLNQREVRYKLLGSCVIDTKTGDHAPHSKRAFAAATCNELNSGLGDKEEWAWRNPCIERHE